MERTTSGLIESPVPVQLPGRRSVRLSVAPEAGSIARAMDQTGR